MSNYENMNKNHELTQQAKPISIDNLNLANKDKAIQSTTPINIVISNENENIKNVQDDSIVIQNQTLKPDEVTPIDTLIKPQKLNKINQQSSQLVSPIISQEDINIKQNNSIQTEQNIHDKQYDINRKTNQHVSQHDEQKLSAEQKGEKLSKELEIININSDLSSYKKYDFYTVSDLEERTNRYAIVSFILGIVSLVFSFFDFPCAIIGLIFAVKAHKTQNSLFSTIGIVTSLLGIIKSLITIILLICYFPVIFKFMNSLLI